MTLKSLSALSLFAASALAADPVYKNDFESSEVGKFPPGMGMMVIDGEFKVIQDGTNKVLELPGAPLESFSLIFGPTEKENRTVTARIFGTSRGRRAPTFHVGLGGVGGYKLQVTPSKKALELFKGAEVKTSVPFEWQTGKWTRLSLTVKKSKEMEWALQGRAWMEDSPEPSTPTLTWTETEEPPTGRASIGGSPYSTTPIRYDDLFTGPAK